MKILILFFVAAMLAAIYIFGLPYGDGGFRGERLREDSRVSRILSLSEYTPFDWDQVFVYQGYWSNEQVSKEVGSRRPYADWVFPSGVTEGNTMLVFKKGDEIRAVVSLFPLQTSLELESGHIGDSKSVFSPIFNENGWLHLKQRPNQALDPTATAVTDPADAGSAPAATVGHR